MAHALSRRRCDAGDESDHGFFHIVLYPACAGFLVVAADFADHDHGVGFRVFIEHAHDINMLQAVDRIAADAHARRLSEAEFHQLADGLVGERTGARHHADAPLLVDVAGHDADLDLIRCDHSRTVRSDEQGLLAAHSIAGGDHVAHRHALGDADDQIEFGVDRLIDGGGGEGRRHIDHRYRRAGPFPGFFRVAVDGDPLETLSCLVRIHAGNEARLAVGVVAAQPRMESAGLSGDALRHHLGVPIDQYAHVNRLLTYFPATAATIFCAASAMLPAEMIGSPEASSICLPSSSFVPFMRTTNGTPSFTSLAAAITPSAMVSQRMMPPNIFTRTPLTAGFFSMSLNASVTFCAVAPPPTSRKFAGSAPNSLMVSIVAMASPAPLTRQPMLPLSEI